MVIKPLDKDIYNFEEEANIAKNRVFGLLQEEYDGKISKVVDSLQGLSVKERVKTFDRLLERLPKIKDIEKLCRRAMDEARGERQKLEYPRGKFLKEKYPELTVQDIQNSPMEQFLDNEWRVELCKRYPEIEEAYEDLPKVQNPALETLLVLLKLKFLRDQELEKLEAKCEPTDTAASSKEPNKKDLSNEPIFNLTEIVWKDKEKFANCLTVLCDKELIINKKESIPTILQLNEKIELRKNSFPELVGLIQALGELGCFTKIFDLQEDGKFCQDMEKIFILPKKEESKIGTPLNNMTSRYRNQSDKKKIQKIIDKHKSNLS